MIKNLTFFPRPAPVFVEHRPLYKIAQMLLILANSRGMKSSLLRLHLLNWSLKSDERKHALANSLQKGELGLPAWGFDPAVAIALNFAIGEGLVVSNTTGCEATERGIAFIKEALAGEGLLRDESMFLSNVGKKVTESMVEVVSKSWG